MGGLTTPRDPKEFLQQAKSNLAAEQLFQASICNIFCMRKATYITDGFRMRAGPLGPLNALKTKIQFLLYMFPTILVFILFRNPWGYSSMVPQRGHI